MRDSSSNIRGDFYLQPIFEDVVLRRHKTDKKKNSVRPCGKNSSPVDSLIFKARNDHYSLCFHTRQKR